MDPKVQILKILAMGLIYGVAFRLATIVWNL